MFWLPATRGRCGEQLLNPMQSSVSTCSRTLYALYPLHCLALCVHLQRDLLAVEQGRPRLRPRRRCRYDLGGAFCRPLVLFLHFPLLCSRDSYSRAHYAATAIRTLLWTAIASACVIARREATRLCISSQMALSFQKCCQQQLSMRPRARLALPPCPVLALETQANRTGGLRDLHAPLARLHWISMVCLLSFVPTSAFSGFSQ